MRRSAGEERGDRPGTRERASCMTPARPVEPAPVCRSGRVIRVVFGSRLPSRLQLPASESFWTRKPGIRVRRPPRWCIPDVLGRTAAQRRAAPDPCSAGRLQTRAAPAASRPERASYDAAPGPCSPPPPPHPSSRLHAPAVPRLRQGPRRPPPASRPWSRSRSAGPASPCHHPICHRSRPRLRVAARAGLKGSQAGRPSRSESHGPARPCASAAPRFLIAPGVMEIRALSAGEERGDLYRRSHAVAARVVRPCSPHGALTRSGRAIRVVLVGSET